MLIVLANKNVQSGGFDILKNLLSNLARHILVVSHFFILVAEFFLNFFEAHLHLLEFSLVLNLHFSLGFVYFDTVCETLF